MPSYPLTLSIPSSLAKQMPASILRECATKIENYLNDEAKNKPVCVVDYYELEIKLGISKEIIKKLLAPRGGSSNSITIHNQKLNLK